MAVKRAVKKTTKTAAKKTYRPAKKTVPDFRRMTMREITAVMAENHAKTEAAIAKTEAAIDRLSAENQKTSDIVRAVSRDLGGLGRHLGRVVEFIVVPKMRHAINAIGNHSFDNMMVDKVVSAVVDGKREFINEMDILLYNDTEAMAVEIKTCLQTHHVKEHLERLQNLRDYEEEAGVKGKKLFGAVVGAVVDSWARALALKNGLYVIEIHEEEDRLDIDKPESCRTW